MLGPALLVTGSVSLASGTQIHFFEMANTLVSTLALRGDLSNVTLESQRLWRLPNGVGKLVLGGGSYMVVV